MRSPIKNIYYFGSLADGFKVYPNDSHLNNIFSTYYNNTETDWFLNVNNDGQSVLYTYVRYGLLTSMNGRTGSCFGIAIEFENSYFIDFDIFIKKIIETIIEIFLNEKVLISHLPNSEIIGFKAYNLSEVSTYLDEMTLRIGKFINSKYSNYILPIHNIKKSDNLTFVGLNNKNSQEVIKKQFELWGSIKLSPKLPLQTITQNESEGKNIIQKRLKEPPIENKKKEKDIKDVKSENENFKKEIENIKLEIIKLKKEIEDIKLENVKQKKEIEDEKKKLKILNMALKKAGKPVPLLELENHSTAFSNQESHIKELDDNKISYLKNPKVIGILVLFVLFILGIVPIFFPNEQGTTNYTQAVNPADTTANEPNCNFDINSNPQKWTYNGSNIHTSEELAKFVTENCKITKCNNWAISLKNNIDSLNTNDVIDGNIKVNKDIIFWIPQNTIFEISPGFKKISN